MHVTVIFEVRENNVLRLQTQLTLWFSSNISESVSLMRKKLIILLLINTVLNKLEYDCDI